MKRLYLWQALLLTVLAAACSSDETVYEPADKSGRIVMTIPDFKYDSPSRTTMDPGLTGCEFRWSKDDTVGIFPDKGNQVAFPVTSGGGSKTASFDGGGWALRSSSEYVAYYPFKGDIYADRSKMQVSYEGQCQNGNLSSEHLGRYDFMAAVARTPQSGIINFNFRHLGALVELSMALPEAGDLKSVRLRTDEEVFILQGETDLTEDYITVTPVARSSSFLVRTEGIATLEDKTVVKVYFMMAPADFSGKPLTVEVENNATVYQGELAVNKFEAGKAYRMALETLRPLNNVFSCQVDQAGTLRELVGEENRYKVEELRVSGELNGTDIRFIRDMAGRDAAGNETAGKLAVLNMTGCRIVAGGESYVSLAGMEYFSKNDTLPESAFYACKALKMVKLPNTVSAVGQKAFWGCSGITSLDIPRSVKRIENGAFEGCEQLKAVDFPEALEHLSGFGNCKGLAAVRIPNSVKTIGENAFAGCGSLKSLFVPGNVRTIGAGAFSGCSRLKIADFDNGLKSVESSLFADCDSLKEVQLPETLVSIGKEAFLNCKSMVFIGLPESLKEIKAHIFYGCSSLEKVFCYATTPPHLEDAIFSSGSKVFVHVPMKSMSLYENGAIWKTCSFRPMK